MKLKYYLRGLGIGIIITTIILMISFSQRKTDISDEEVMARAAQLGMIMPEEKDAETETQSDETETQADKLNTEEEEPENPADTQAIQPDGQDSTAEGTPSEEQNPSADGTDSVAEGTQSEGQSIPTDGAEPSANGTQSDGAENPADTAGTPETPAGETQPQDGVYRLTIKKGDVCRVVCENLAANGVIEDAEALRKYLFEIGYANTISTGEYDVPYGLTMEEVGQLLKKGPTIPGE